VERSRDGSEFACIARVAATDIREGDTFSHTDTRPPPGRNLYRVTAYTDGARPLSSPVRQVLAAATTSTPIYPNPTRGLLHIPADDPERERQAAVIDPTGRWRMGTRLPAGRTGTLDVGQLPPGEYLLRIWSKDSVTTYRFTRAGHAGR